MLGKYDILERKLCDCQGQAVGQVTAYYRYPDKFDAPWGLAEVTRRHMIFMKATHLVDLHDAVVRDGAVVTAYTAETITTAPNYRPIIGNVLTRADAAEVLQHYGAQSVDA